MKKMILLFAFAASATCAADAQPIAELKLPNGTVFRNVTIVRYEKDRVVLKSSAGVGGIPYHYVSEPLRSQMIAERNVFLAQKSASDKEAQTAEAENINARSLQQSQALLAREARDRQMADAIRKQYLLVGMTGSELIQSWGNPVRTNTSSSGVLNQWVYIKPSGTVYVYFDGGAVTSWQYR